MIVYIETLKYGLQIKGHVFFGESYLYQDANYTICLEKINKAIYRFIVTIGLMFSSIFIAFIYPMYVWYRDGILYTLNEFLIPFVEGKNDLSVTLNVVYQLILAFILINGLVLIQVHAALFMNTIEISTSISRNEMKNLSDSIERSGMTKSLIRMNLVKIFNQIMRIDE